MLEVVSSNTGPRTATALLLHRKKNRNSNFREKRISVKILHLSLCLWGTLKNKARESWWCSKYMLNEEVLGMARVCGLGL